MGKAKIIKGLYQIVVENELDKILDRQATSVATAIYSYIESLMWLSVQPNAMLFRTEEEKIEPQKEHREENVDVNEFVDKMYSLYPTKCPKRNCSLGKSKKDKVRIKALLKVYSKEQIEQVIRNEVDANYGVNYMKNFSTFLNNFPDPSAMSSTEGSPMTQKQNDAVIINGVTYK